MLELALEQLDAQALDGEILVRADGAGASHELTQFCRDGAMRFSVGFDLDERVREAIAGLSETAWMKAIRVDGSQREHSQVAEINRPRRPFELACGVAADRQAHQAQRRRPAVLRRPRRIPPGGLPSPTVTQASPSSIWTIAATLASRTASAKPRTAAWPICRFGPSLTTRCGYGW